SGRHRTAPERLVAVDADANARARESRLRARGCGAALLDGTDGYRAALAVPRVFSRIPADWSRPTTGRSSDSPGRVVMCDGLAPKVCQNALRRSHSPARDGL